MLREVEENRGGFEDDEIVSGVVDKNGKAPIWIEFDEPRFLIYDC